MRIVSRVLLVVALALGSGCASTDDWIDRTLVTVDVTGTWYGKTTGGFYVDRRLLLELKQQGSTVKGLVQFTPSHGFTPGPIDGTVAGDVFRFRDSKGILEGELTVSGDEMNGHGQLLEGRRPMSLRRVDPSAPPASPPR